MTSRDEAIEQAAEAHRVDGAGPSDICHNCQAFKYASFIAGARFADENPKPNKFSEFEQVINETARFRIATLEAKLKIATEALENIGIDQDTNCGFLSTEKECQYYIDLAKVSLQRIRE